MNEEKKIITANELTNVKDVKDIFLYTKDGYVMTYLQISSYNIDLMSKEEKRQKTLRMAASFDGDRKDFVYFTFPREIDLDLYKQDLKKRYSDEFTSPGRKHILQELILESIELATNGENYEHQHFIKLWKKIGVDRGEAETDIRNRTEEFKSRYQESGIQAEILRDQTILKMCTLFSNAMQAPYETIDQNSLYESTLKMK